MGHSEAVPKGPWANSCPMLARVMLGGIFLISGLAKISDPVRFLFTLRDFRLFPGGVESFLAVYIPWLEFILGLALLLGLLSRTAFLMLAALNFGFIIAIGSVIVRGIEVDCGCFGLLADMLHLPDMADWKAIVRNTIFIVMSLAAARSDLSAWSLEKYIVFRYDKTAKARGRG